MNWLYDAHIHLSDLEYEDDITRILNSMKKIHIKACCVSMDYTSSKKTLELGKKSNLVFPFIGVHPEKAQDNVQPAFELINKNKEIISELIEKLSIFKIVEMMRNAGALEVHMRISSPPIKFPDFYGIDTPNPSELIASSKSVEEIKNLLKLVELIL